MEAQNLTESEVGATDRQAEAIESGAIESGDIALVEALIFAAGEPLEADRISRISALSHSQVQAIIAVLQERYQHESVGFELLLIAGKYQLRSKPQFAGPIRELKAEAPRRLSAAALETLSVIAYRQPVTRADIEHIRGVDVTPTIKTLLERGLIKILGHQNTVGQPALYGTTDEFLKLFGLGSLSELPSLRDISDLEKDPGENAA